MSQETPIGNLGGSISEEDSKLVDSILNDINNSNSSIQETQNTQNGQNSQPSPEQIKMIQQQQMMRQQAMAQQQQAMAQQQALAQQQAQQKMNIIQSSGSNDIFDNIKLEAKNIMTIIFLCVLFNIEQFDNLLKGFSIFVLENGNLSMQAIFLKSILIGMIFYLIKTYLL